MLGSGLVCSCFSVVICVVVCDVFRDGFEVCVSVYWVILDALE